MEKLLTVRQAAVALACSDAWVRDLIRRGRLRATQDGRWLRVPESAIEEFVAARTRP